jgi:hypothetical protein
MRRRYDGLPVEVQWISLGKFRLFLRDNVLPVQAREVRYAKSGEVAIAYQVVGDGPLDLPRLSDGPLHRHRRLEATRS